MPANYIVKGCCKKIKKQRFFSTSIIYLIENEKQPYLKYKSNEQAKQQTRTVYNKLPGHEVRVHESGQNHNHYLNNFIDFFCGCGGIIKDVCFTADNYNWQ